MAAGLVPHFRERSRLSFVVPTRHSEGLVRLQKQQGNGGRVNLKEASIVTDQGAMILTKRLWFHMCENVDNSLSSCAD